MSEFCKFCGAGIGEHKRAGEGTCPKCDPSQTRHEHHWAFCTKHNVEWLYQPGRVEECLTCKHERNIPTKHPRREPNPGETKTPLFEAIWRVVKDWEVEDNGVKWSVTGNDVCQIIDSIKAADPRCKSVLDIDTMGAQYLEQCELKSGHDGVHRHGITMWGIGSQIKEV